MEISETENRKKIRKKSVDTKVVSLKSSTKLINFSLTKKKKKDQDYQNQEFKKRIINVNPTKITKIIRECSGQLCTNN